MGGVSTSSNNLSYALGTVGDRWTLQIVAELLTGPKRFGELNSLPGIAPNVLTARLRQLERQHLIAAVPYSVRPLRLAYRLTDAGRELQGVVALLSAWGAGQTGEASGVVHQVCGTNLEARLYCGTCEREVADPNADDLYWA